MLGGLIKVLGKNIIAVPPATHVILHKLCIIIISLCIIKCQIVYL